MVTAMVVRYLESCLRSVTSQEEVDLAVLVLDDASTDDSLSTAHRISRRRLQSVNYSPQQ